MRNTDMKAMEMVKTHNVKKTPISLGRILHAEDDPMVAYPVGCFLRGEGYEVEHVLNGKEALSRILAEPNAYDLLLTDYSLPELNGLQCVKDLRENGFAGKVLVFSGCLPDLTEDEVLAVGVDQVLYKSATPYSLRRAIQDLQNSRGPDRLKPLIPQTITTQFLFFGSAPMETITTIDYHNVQGQI